MFRAGNGASRIVRALFALAVVASAAVPASAGADPGNAAPKIEAVSTKAEYVSGGDVLVRVQTHDAGAATHLRIELDGVDVMSSFHGQPDGSLLGLVGGMSVGPHTILARANGKGKGTPPGRSAALDVVNHPITGALFSGPQQQPFFCETTAPAFGLGPASTDGTCSAPTQVTYLYRTTAGAFAALADPTTRPADLAQTTVNGRTVDYIVRLERGTIDRAVYEIAALYDPAAPPSPYSPEPGWNEKLVYTFGGGCNVGYHQGASTGGVLSDLFLSRGYAVASSSLNVLDTNCSDVISAEAALMVKEHFIEEYGPLRYTIGSGGSGGAIQQHLIGNNYPGILDGILPGISFADAATVMETVTDCRLFFTYFTSPAGLAAGWTAAQQAAASGYGTFASCRLWHLTFASRVNALEGCPGAVPVSARYDPVANPSGIKCTAFEQMVNQLGRDPATGFAYRPLDNVGVQYGLTALRAGAITPEQFVSLNENLGGYDVVGRIVGQRTVADPIGLTRAYQTGRVNNAGLGLASTPIIDNRVYTDPIGDIHTRFWSFVLRQRLIAANGTAANHVQFVTNAAGNAAMNVEALTQMDAWLAAIAADEAPGAEAERTIRNRPVGLTDTCWTSATTAIHETFSYGGSGFCDTTYPAFGSTRTAAGGPIAEDIEKCRLTPIDRLSYGVTFTPAQQARLAATFPTGVCDWSQPGVEQQPPLGSWLSWGS